MCMGSELEGPAANSCSLRDIMTHTRPRTRTHANAPKQACAHACMLHKAVHTHSRVCRAGRTYGALGYPHVRRVPWHCHVSVGPLRMSWALWWCTTALPHKCWGLSGCLGRCGGVPRHCHISAGASRDVLGAVVVFLSTAAV